MSLFYEHAASAAVIKHGITVQTQAIQFINPKTTNGKGNQWKKFLWHQMPHCSMFKELFIKLAFGLQVTTFKKNKPTPEGWGWKWQWQGYRKAEMHMVSVVTPSESMHVRNYWQFVAQRAMDIGQSFIFYFFWSSTGIFVKLKPPSSFLDPSLNGRKRNSNGFLFGTPACMHKKWWNAAVKVTGNAVTNVAVKSELDMHSSVQM